MLENLKNYLLNQDISEIKKTLKIKIFDYFYSILGGRSTTSFFILYFFHSIEIIQLISYAFSSSHKSVWKLPEKTNNFIKDFTSGFRLAPLLNYLKLKIFETIIFVFFAFILILFLILIVQISFRKENSPFYEKIRNFTQLTIPFITILFFIPLNEMFLSVFDCKENHIYERTDEIRCWKTTHILLILTSAISLILNIIINTLFTFFYFYPFITQKQTIKLTPTVDLLLLLIKLILVIQNIFIKDEYISIVNCINCFSLFSK